MDMKKICLIGPSNSSHIIKWAKYFISQNYEVHVISFINSPIPDIILHYIPVSVKTFDSDRKKIEYLKKAGDLRKTVKKIVPNYISVHYASSYGAVVALSGIRDYSLSVWGSDIYDFPTKGFLHKMLLKFSLSRASRLLSTSNAMADEASKYTKRKFRITPFGVDVNLFSPDKRNRAEDDDKFIIGTVKALSPNYGIDYLLKAAAIIIQNYPEINLEVRIAGTGTSENEYKKLTKSLGIEKNVFWLGFISQEKAAMEWANMDIGIVYSNRESFGVSAVEAQACGIPIIISDVPGLMEASNPNISSIVVAKRNEFLLSKAIMDLYYNKEKRVRMGIYGREYVIENYELTKCFKIIESFVCCHV